MKTVELKNPKAVEYLKKRRPHILKGREITREMEELQEKHEKLKEERQKCGLEAQKWQDKIVPIVQEEIELDEFEEVRSVKEEKDKALVEIVNVVEEYKELYQEKIKQQKENAKSDSGDKE